MLKRTRFLALLSPFDLYVECSMKELARKARI